MRNGKAQCRCEVNFIDFFIGMQRAGPKEAVAHGTTQQHRQLIRKAKFRTACLLGSDDSVRSLRKQRKESKTPLREQLREALIFVLPMLTRIRIASVQCHHNLHLFHVLDRTEFSLHCFQFWRQKCIGTNCLRSTGHWDRCLV